MPLLPSVAAAIAGPPAGPPTIEVIRALPPLRPRSDLVRLDGCLRGEPGSPPDAPSLLGPRGAFFGEVLLSSPGEPDSEPVFLARDPTGTLLAPPTLAQAAPLEAWLSEWGAAPARVHLAAEGGALVCRPAELPARAAQTVEVEVEVSLTNRDAVVLVLGCGGHLWAPERTGGLLAVDPTLLPCPVRGALVNADGWTRWGDPVTVERVDERIHVVVEPLGILPIGSEGLFDFPVPGTILERP